MKILIIDDDKNTCEILGKFLELKGHSSTIVYDGKSGLELIQKNGFDRVVLDMFMPKFTGVDFLKELTRTGLIHKTKVIIYSAVPYSTDEVNSLLKSGAVALVSKGKGFEELLEALESA